MNEEVHRNSRKTKLLKSAEGIRKLGREKLIPKSRNRTSRESSDEAKECGIAHGQCLGETEREMTLMGACGRARCDERWHREEPKPRSRPSDNHLRRLKINMSIRDSFSRLKKKLKRSLTGGRRKPERVGADVAGEEVDRAGSLLRSESHPEVRVEGTENVGRSYPSPSAPSILESGKPGGT